MKEKHGKKRISALLTAIFLLVGMLPTAAFSAENGAKWKRAGLEEITAEDTVAVTMTRDGITWALDNSQGTSGPPEAIEVTVDGDTMTAEDDEKISWNLVQEEGGLLLYVAGGEEVLYTDNNNMGVRVGAYEGAYWTVEDGYLYFIYTGRYLGVNMSKVKWTTPDGTTGNIEGETLSFWVLDTEPEDIPESSTESTTETGRKDDATTESTGESGGEDEGTTESTGESEGEDEGTTESTGETEGETEETTESTGETEGTTESTEGEKETEYTGTVLITPEETEVFLKDEDIWITLSCEMEGAAIFYAISTDGETYTDFCLYEENVQDLLLTEGFDVLFVKAYAEKEGYLPSEETVRCFTERKALGEGFYFGQLHAHSDLSDGLGTAEDIFAYVTQVNNLDFFALTDHSNSFDNDSSATIGTDAGSISLAWAEGKSAAEAATQWDFVGIYGYEMTWQEGKQLGHLNTFHTPGFLSRNQEDYASQPTALPNYYDALTTVSGSVSQFNHPGTQYGDFHDFDYYTESRDAAITLLEVGTGADAYFYYNRALDKGWHVAPTNYQSNSCSHDVAGTGIGEGRTVVYAESLTEAGIYDAMKHYRVYATEDSDLTIRYTLDGYRMGSILERRNLGDTVTICVTLDDPTDGAAGQVAVIADGGRVLAEQTSGADALTFEIPAAYSYYYIRVIQPDGDSAVTAPVWVNGEVNAGIESFICDTVLPVQNQEVNLSLELYHSENSTFTVEKIEFSVDGRTVQVMEGDGLSRTFSYTHPGLGHTELCVTVTATLNGEIQTYQQTLTLNYRRPDMVKALLVDGSCEENLSGLIALAEENQITVTAAEEITGEMLDGIGILIVTVPKEAFSDSYVEQVAEFVATGGTLVVCGQSAQLDGDFSSAEELNRLLEAAGATMRLQADTAADPVNNGGTETELYLADVNPVDICAAVTKDQVYCQVNGCTVAPGNGTKLVSTGSSAVLAWEETASGSSVYAAGSLFLGNSELADPKNIWDAPYANRTILNSLLRVERTELALSRIGDVRTATLGEVYRVRGYVTAGTSDPYNRFPETLYLQDDTGGIAVVPFEGAGIEVGAPLEVQGYLDMQDGNAVLEVITWETLEASMREYAPQTIPNAEAMDYALHGGELVQIEGKVVELTRTGSKGISRLVLKDDAGDLATVLIEDEIFSGATGENTLAKTIRKGRQVRAMGIVHINSDGATVLRVRNCDEVVYIQPSPYTKSDPTNPKTGDAIHLPALTMLLSAAGTALVRKKRKK